MFSYIEVIGGNKNREGFIYKLTGFGSQTDIQNRIEQDIQATLKSVWEAYHKGQQAPSKEAKQEPQQQEPSKEPQQEVEQEPTKKQQLLTEEPQADKQPTFFDRNYKRIRINEKEEYTLKLILELEAKEPNRKYLASDLTAITGRSKCTEARQLKTLWEQGKLSREWKDRQYFYSLNTNSKTVSQTEVSNPQRQSQ